MRSPLSHRRPARLAVLALVGTLLCGCTLLPGGGGEQAAEKKKATGAATAWQRADVADVRAGGTLRLAVSAPPGSYNPLHADAAGSELDRLLGPTTGSAVRITDDGGWEVDPDYAESVEVVEQDPLTVRVELNPDAVWDDGSPITSADQVSQWEALRGTNVDFDVASTDGWDDVEAVRPDGDEAYEVEFSGPRSDWPLFVYPRLPKAITADAKSFDRAFADDPVPSNGPFRITSIDAETGTITQDRNPEWWGDEPRLKQIVWRVATPQVQAEALAADELDVATLDAAGIDAVDDDLVQRAAGSEWTHLTLNAGRGPLKDVKVRQAVSAALDRPALAKAAAQPLGAPARTADSPVLLPGQVGHAQVAEPQERDLKTARGLLEDAGYEVSGGDTPRATKDGDPLTLRLRIAGGSRTVADRAAAVADQLAQVGITVEVDTTDPRDFSDDVLVPLDFDLLTFSWGPSLLGPETAEERYRPRGSAANLTGVSDDGDPWAKARRALDPDDLVEATRALDEHLRDQAVILPLTVVPSVVAVRQGVVNVGATTFEQPRWTTAGFLAED